MRATLLLRERLVLEEALFVEVVLWLLPAAVPGSFHTFKYRFVLVDEGRCVLRYDNEAGKGDHKHVGEREVTYVFVDLEMLQSDF